MDTSRLSSSLRFGITERGVIARPRWTRFYYRLLKSLLLFRNAIRQFNQGKDATNRFYIQTSTFISTRMQSGIHARKARIQACTYAIIQPTKAKQRNYDRLFIMYTLISFTSGLGATSLIQRNKETPHQRQGGRLDLWGLYVHGALKTERAPRGRAGYLHLCGASLGRPATSRPHGS